MSKWKEYKLGEIIDVRDGTHDSPKQKDIGKPLVTSRHIKGGKIDLSTTYSISIDDFDKINRRSKVDKWDVLFSMIGTIGEMVIIKEEPDFAIKNIGLFKAKDEYTSKWIYYYLQSPKAQSEILSSLKGSTQQYISLTDLRNFPITYPPIKEGWGIIQILSSLDDKIELNNKINQELETLSQTLFKQWFIDFEFPNENGEPYKSSGGEMVDSELGVIPKGWEVGLLNKIASLDKGNVKPYENPEKQYFHYSLPDFDNGKKPSITNGKEILSSKYKITPFSILVSKLNPRIPRVWIITDCNENSICSTEFQVIKPKKIEYFSFLCTLCSSNTFFDSLKSKVTGTSSSHQRVNPNDIINYKFQIPKDDIILKFDSIISDIFIKKNNNIIENSSLILTRDTLLPKLISGELEINEINN